MFGLIMDTKTMNIVNILIGVGLVALVGIILYAFWSRRIKNAQTK